MINSLVLIVTKPIGVELSALGLRTAWACHENSFDIKLLYSDEGVWCAINNDGYHATMIKKFIDVEGRVYCIEENLMERCIIDDDIIGGVKIISKEDVAGLCDESESIICF